MGDRKASIRIRGARTHNLKDLDLDLPREAWTVVCGVSGSGKSSLVLDTLGAESRRRFLGTLSRVVTKATAVARPDVDRIEGLPPAVTAGFTARDPGPRHTLGTVTEITHALRSLFARAAAPHCPECGAAVGATTRDEVTARLLDRPEGTRLVLVAPRGKGPGALEDAVRDGFVRVRIASGPVQRVEEIATAEIAEDARVEAVVDRLVVKSGAEARFAASIDQAFDFGAGVLRVMEVDREGGAQEQTFTDRPYCGRCDVTWPRLTPGVFSFNSPSGACPSCEGRGFTVALDVEKILPRRLRIGKVAAHLARHLPREERQKLQARIDRAASSAGLEARARIADLPEEIRTKLLEGGGRAGPGLHKRLEGVRSKKRETLSSAVVCEACAGTRLAPYARAARLDTSSLPQLEDLPAEALLERLDSMALPGVEGRLAAPALEDATQRLRFLCEVGLGYLAPQRAANTLSGGELRRARLAAACAARMSGLLYLLDEPTAGLHPADRPALRDRLRRLVEEGNTVICVEHDPTVLRTADHALELGPGAGIDGGAVLAQGDVSSFVAHAQAPLARALRATPPKPRGEPRRDAGRLVVRGARAQNLEGVDVRLPLAGFTCLTGVSGAGKSTLLLQVLAPAVRSVLDRAPFPHHLLDALEGMEGLERASVARGAPPRHPRASPGTVLAVLPPLRRLYASTLEARTRGWSASRFSPHVPGGRCEACRGTGERRVALRDLAPARIVCESCEGTGFHRETLKVRVKGLAISDALALPLQEAATLFRDIPAMARPLLAATDVGLGYLPLGTPTSRLSGGEALRLRLAAALGRGGVGPTLYLLDEPSAGLHPTDVAHLAEVLLRLGEEGHTVVAVEHHLHLVRLADHVVELGPGPGDEGGRIVYEGPPAGLLGRDDVATGRALDAEENR